MSLRWVKVFPSYFIIAGFQNLFCEHKYDIIILTQRPYLAFELHLFLILSTYVRNLSGGYMVRASP